MKKTELKIGTTPKSSALWYISLSFVCIFILSGRTTPALDLAERKASPSVTHTDWNLKKVRSAVEQENGDISVCVELYASHNRNKSECYAITMPNPSWLKETTDLASLGFMEQNAVGHPPDPYSTDYLYPFLKGEEDRSIEMNENGASKHSDILLIYWPSGMDQEIVQPIGIGGGYESEDESAKLYYLLVPPAVMLDIIIITLALAAQGGGY